MYAFLFDRRSLTLTVAACLFTGLLFFGLGFVAGSHFGVADDSQIRTADALDLVDPLPALAASEPANDSPLADSPTSSPPPRRLPPLPSRPEVGGAATEVPLTSLFPGSASSAEGGPRFAVCVAYRDGQELADEVSALIRRQSASPEGRSWQMRVFQPGQENEVSEGGPSYDEPPP